MIFTKFILVLAIFGAIISLLPLINGLRSNKSFNYKYQPFVFCYVVIALYCQALWG